MKRTLLATLATGIALCSFGQDTTVSARPTVDTTGRPDTIRIGGMVIIRDGKADHPRTHSITFGNSRRHNSNLSTNWAILDLGFSNFDDHTSYAASDVQAFAPGADADRFKLRTGKSVNVNIWILMQKLNLVKHVVNLKYGIGLELNNYRFDNERVHFLKNPTRIIDDSSWSEVDKNKLAADYLTVPIMLNFDLTPSRKHGFGFSVGVSAGYLYSARQKIKEDGKVHKTHGDFDLDPWKISAIAEVQLGPIRLYGSSAFNSMWSKGLDQRPYNVGIRLSHW
ncbi:hypothetical protein EPD60_03100 [Flaviaesturariibacter flavus]|uniref:Outer membrane protein beta-barrel domain-containing protein n=1 Tax=Flaviaesturariibacter flavus TaxID=2502780 RepID=A0A4R1BMP5_9BACT|nr:outer membrane beta-barrel protein [Flaviaesturariibacter flavus]TCJ18761.1 hypothetical protein EPD60_03100 [Flaviaesturariibacter flavus]